MGIYHYQSRFPRSAPEAERRGYSPKLGRFLSADSLVPNPFNPQEYNRYSYVRNNPVRYTDPSGHACVEGTSYCVDPMTRKKSGSLTSYSDIKTGGEPDDLPTDPEPRRCRRGCDNDTPDPNPNNVPAPIPELSKDDDASLTPTPATAPTPEPSVTPQVAMTSTTTVTQPSGTQLTDQQKIAWTVFGVALIVVGLIALTGGIVLGVAAIGAIIEGGIGAELGMALFGLVVDTQLLGWTGIAGIWSGFKAIEKGSTP